MKVFESTILISFAILGLANANLIVERELDMSNFAEGIASTVKYTFYNSFGRYSFIINQTSDIYNIELDDLHFANDSFFEFVDPEQTSIKLNIEQLSG